jgi:WXG100 family type VII secretion target
MSADIVQAQYDELEAVAGRFGKQAEAQLAMRKTLKIHAERLRGGGWQGVGATAFYAEMDGKVFPALDRLVAALNEAQKVTRQISALVRSAEQEAARLFESREAPALPIAGISPGELVLGMVAPPSAPAPDVPARSEFQRFLDTLLAAKPIFGEILLDKLGVGEIKDGIELLFTQKYFDEMDRARDAWAEARRQHGENSPEASAAREKYDDTYGNMPILGPYIKALLDMGRANPVY